MKTTSMVWSAVACAVCLACGNPPTPTTAVPTAHGDGGAAPEAATEVIGRKILHRKEYAEIPGKESVMYVSTLPVKGTSGRHTHPGTELSYLISGKLHIDNEGNPELSRDVNAGESFSSVANKVHDVKNIGDEPAKIVTVIILDKGAQLATPVK